MSRTLYFETADWGMEPRTSSLWQPIGLAFVSPMGLKQMKNQFLVGIGELIPYPLPQHTHPIAIHLGLAQREQEKKLPISKFVHGRALTIYFPRWCLWVHLPIGLHLGANYDPSLGTLTVLAHSQLLGATKCKKISLENHKVSRDN